jgi:hypothetical protein
VGGVSLGVGTLGMMVVWEKEASNSDKELVVKVLSERADGM